MSYRPMFDPLSPQAPHLRKVFRFVSTLLLMSLLFTLGQPIAPALAQEPTGSDTLFTDAGVQADPLLDEATIIRQRFVNVNFDVLGGESAPSVDSSVVGKRLELNLFDGTTLIAVRERIESNLSGSYTWSGHVEGVEFSHVTLVIKDGVMVGKVAMPTAIYEVRYVGANLHAIIEIDQSAFPSEENDTIEVELPEEENRLPTAISASDDGTVIDVLVVYTADAKTGAGGTTAAIESTIELAVSETNQAYENSNVNQRLVLVHMEEVTYSETGNSSTDLYQLRNTSDGVIDNVLTLRNTYHADNVVLIFENGNGGCGSSSFMATVSSSFESSAYAVVARDCATGKYSFGHELGHNMGLRHDWYVDSNTTPYTYAHGYSNTAGAWRTIMAYGSHCLAVNGSSCTRLIYFSNPSVTYGGDPMGVADGSSTSCTAGSTSPNPSSCDADSRSTLNNTAATTAAFRSSEIVWTGATSTDWNTMSNWDIEEGVPGSTSTVHRVPRTIDNVRLPTDLANYPTISSGTMNAREVLIETGATLNITGGTFNVYGSWEEQGTGSTTMSGGTVVFKSNLDQTITASANSTFNNVQIGDSTSQNVTLSSNLDVNGNLTLSAGATLSAGSNTLNVAGNWRDEGNGFVYGTSTVIFDGSSQTVDKVTSSTLLNEPFDEADSQTCCSSAYLPSGWTREHTSGNGFLGGDLGAGGMAIRWDSSSDAWLHTTGFALEPGVTYQISYKYANSALSAGATSDFSLSLGTSPSSASMTTQLHSVTGVSSSSLTTANATFTVATAGTYYFGIRSQINTGSNYGLVDDVTLIATQNITFYNLTTNSTGQSVTFSKDVVVQNNLVTNTYTQMDFGSNSVTVEGTVTNNGSLKQTQDASTVSTTYEYLTIKNAAGDTTKYYGVNITPTGGALGSTAVIISGSRDCVNPVDSNLVRRCFDITPTTANAATIKYWFTQAEGNGRAANALKVWDWNGSSWVQVGAVVPGGTYGSGATCTNDADCWVQWAGISTFSPMALGDGATPPTGSPVDPLAVDLASFVALDASDHVLLTWETAIELDKMGFKLYKSLNDSHFANSIQINEALIPAQGPGSGQGFIYQYEDYEVQGGKTYFYWLKDIDLNGNGTLHGPISISLDVPTVVTTSELGAISQISIGWGLAPLLLMLLMGGIFIRRRRRRS